MSTAATATEGLGNTQYTLDLPANLVIMIRTATGERAEFRVTPAEVHIATIHEYKDKVNVRGAEIPYVCFVNASPKPGESMNQFERTLTDDLRRAIHNSFRSRSTSLIVQFHGERAILFDVEYKGKTYACRAELRAQ